MPIVINKQSGLQSKRSSDINKDDVVITYSSPSATGYRRDYSPPNIKNLPYSPQMSMLPNAKDIPMVVSAPEASKKGLDRLSTQLRDRISILRTQQLRGQPTNQALIAALAAGKTVVDEIRGIRDLPQTGKTIYQLGRDIRSVEDLKNLGTSIETSVREGGARFGSLIRESPVEATAIVGTNVALFKGTSKALSVLNKAAKIGYTKYLDPKYLGKLKAGRTYIVKLKIPKTNRFVNISIKKVGSAGAKLKGGRIIKASIRKGRAVIKVSQKGRRIQKIKLKAVKKIPLISLKEQIRLAGRTVSPVSGQADRLLTLFRRAKRIKKPLRNSLGNVIKLNKDTRRILRKLDKSGKLTLNEIKKLNKEARKIGSKGILERSFFADPKGRIRLQRIVKGTEKEASFMDYLSGDVKFTRGRPQILIFKKQMLSKFPKSLRKIANKVKKGKRLTTIEQTKLIKWQLKNAKRFKPLGFTTREAEITARGIVKRISRPGTYLYKGKRVSVVYAGLKKPSQGLAKLIKKAKIGKITRREVRKLRQLYRRETGTKLRLKKITGTARYKPKGRVLGRYRPKGVKLKKYIKRTGRYTIRDSKGRYFSIRRRVAAGALKRRPYKKIRTKKGRYPIKTYRYPPTKTPYPPKRPPRYPGKKPPTGKTPFYPYPTEKPPTKTPPTKYPPVTTKVPRIPPKLGRFISRKSRLRLKKPGKVQGFNVYGKSGRRYIKLNKMPLSKNDALSRGSYAVDHSTAKTFKIIPTKAGQLGHIKPKEGRYYNKIPKKFRGYKIRRGAKYKLKRRYIERRRYGIDTRGEVRGLSLARLAKREGYTRK